MKKIIGIVGGVGPYSGIDINKKIYKNISAEKDQDYIDVFLLSRPEKISDRTEFLLGKTNINPAIEIYKTIAMLEKIGASVVGIPCNTCHAPKIFDEIKNFMTTNHNKIKILHLIEEVYDYFNSSYKEFKKIGLLCTIGTYKYDLYKNIFSKNKEFKILYPSDATQKKIHDSIYNKKYGIKVSPFPVSQNSINILKEAIEELKEKGAQTIIMGCSEIPIALRLLKLDIPLIDPNTILARRLIEEVDKNLLI